MFSTARGGQWIPPPTKTLNDSGHESPLVAPTNVGNGKAHYAATDTDSSTHKENIVQFIDSHTSSLPLNGRQWSDTNATTDVAATHTTLKVEHRQTT